MKLYTNMFNMNEKPNRTETENIQVFNWKQTNKLRITNVRAQKNLENYYTREASLRKPQNEI